MSTMAGIASSKNYLEKMATLALIALNSGFLGREKFVKKYHGSQGDVRKVMLESKIKPAYKNPGFQKNFAFVIVYYNNSLL